MSAQKQKLLQLRDSIERSKRGVQDLQTDVRDTSRMDVSSTRNEILESMNRSPLKLYENQSGRPNRVNGFATNGNERTNGRRNGHVDGSMSLYNGNNDNAVERKEERNNLKLDSFQAKRVIEDVRSPVKPLSHEQASKKPKVGADNRSGVTGETSFGSPRSGRFSGQPERDDLREEQREQHSKSVPRDDLKSDLSYSRNDHDQDRLQKVEKQIRAQLEFRPAELPPPYDMRDSRRTTRLRGDRSQSSSVSRIPKPQLSLNFDKPSHLLDLDTPNLKNSSKLPSLVTRKPKVNTISNTSPEKEDDDLSLVDVDVTEHLPSKSKSTPDYTSQSEVDRLKAHHKAEIVALRAKLSGKEAELVALKKELVRAEQQVASHDAKVTEIVNKVARQLHTQYSEKHQEKVKSLKSLYERKFLGEINQLKDRINALEEALDDERQQHDGEIAQLNQTLKAERLQHSQMVNAFEEYLAVKGDELDMGSESRHLRHENFRAQSIHDQNAHDQSRHDKNRHEKTYEHGKYSQNYNHYNSEYERNYDGPDGRGYDGNYDQNQDYNEDA